MDTTGYFTAVVRQRSRLRCSLICTAGDEGPVCASRNRGHPSGRDYGQRSKRPFRIKATFRVSPGRSADCLQQY